MGKYASICKQVCFIRAYAQ